MLGKNEKFTFFHSTDHHVLEAECQMQLRKLLFNESNLSPKSTSFQ